MCVCVCAVPRLMMEKAFKIHIKNLFFNIISLFVNVFSSLANFNHTDFNMIQWTFNLKLQLLTTCVAMDILTQPHLCIPSFLPSDISLTAQLGIYIMQIILCAHFKKQKKNIFENGYFKNSNIHSCSFLHCNSKK